MTLARTLAPSAAPSSAEDPLDWFVGEHARHRDFCRLLRDVAADETFDAAQVQAALGFLEREMPRHFAEEEKVLFPALQASVSADDDVVGVIRRLRGEHRLDAERARMLAEELRACLAQRRAPASLVGMRRALEEFASSELHHLALENAVVLPIARLRLSAAGRRAMLAELTQRRLAEAAQP